MRHLLNVFLESDANIRPHVFLTGPSGSGKSFIVETLCKEMEVPYIEVNAAQLTSEGVSGNSLSKALRPLRQHWNVPNVIFVDEFDKIVQVNGNESETFRSSVQDEFLRTLEADKTSVFSDYGKYEPVRISNSLFIFAGAFSNQEIKTLEQMKETGLRNEFVGRVPLVLATQAVSMDSLLAALPHSSLLAQYLQVFPKVQKRKAILDISNQMKTDKDLNHIGIRLMNSLIHRYFMSLN